MKHKVEMAVTGVLSYFAPFVGALLLIGVSLTGLAIMSDWVADCLACPTISLWVAIPSMVAGHVAGKVGRRRAYFE